MTKIVKINVITIASILRKPKRINNNSKNTSNAVVKTDAIIDQPNSKCNAIAPPITSAISVAINANSVIIQRTKPPDLLVRARVAWAKSSRLTIPNLPAMYCNIIAINDETNTTDKSV